MKLRNIVKRKMVKYLVALFFFLIFFSKIEMKKFVNQQQQLFITKTENEFVKQVRSIIMNFYLKSIVNYSIGI